ncbi:MAG: serine/threonine protein kinase [Deltaproteobacteria bacterium]|nr:serine/threonine protein kinase [Deltaproteobacteria bacterium]
MLGKYRLLAELGSGGAATVFLVVMRGPSGFSKLLVLKVLRPQLAEDSDVVSSFLDEARLAARLNHPNVVQTNEVGVEGGHHLIAMEYLDGVALNQLIDRVRRRGSSVPLGMHLRIIHEALNGLHYAHELTDFDGSPLELVHRDVSPHNLFVTFDGQVKMLDFGIAKFAGSSHDTQTGVIKGKIRYMSPEQLGGEKVDRRADVFSVGAMLWEAATGEKLWKGRGDVEIMSRVVAGEVPSPRELKPDANASLDRICRKALSKKREDRYASCLELQADLEKLLDELGDRTTSRDIGRYLNETFRDLRLQRKAVIEAQLTSASRTGAGELPALGEIDHASMPSLPSASHSLEKELPDITPSASNKMQATATSLPPERTGPKVSWTFVAGALAVVGLVVAGLIVIRPPATAPSVASTPSASAPPPAPAATTAAPVASSGAPAPAVAEATLTVRAEPEIAKLFLDGQALATNPSSHKLPRDGASHVLRAEAPGYATKTLTVTLEADRDVLLSLDKHAGAGTVHPTPTKAAATTASAAPPPAPPPAPSSTETKPSPATTGKKPPKSIDSANPWD